MRDLPSVCFYCADQNPPRDRSRGITAYTYGLLSHLRDADRIKVVAVVSRSSFPIPDGIMQFTLPFRTDHVPGRLLADHLHPLIIRSPWIDIWHYPKGFLPAGVQVRSRRVGTIADVIVQVAADHSPESPSSLDFRYWLWMLRHSIRSLDLILTVSEFSKQAILEFCDRHRLKSPPIVVTYEGVAISTPSNEIPQTKENCAVHLAPGLPNKATKWLLTQWQSLQASGKELPELRLVGDLDDREALIFSKLKNATLVGPLPRSQLEKVIAKARVLLLPSEIEGFGIPAVEAYLLGTPVLYVKETAVEEIIGKDAPGGFYRQRDSFETALAQVLELDSAWINQKSASLKRRYDWEDCIRRTLEGYKLLLS